MKLLRKKLNSKRGASIVLALVFFLVCAAIGAVLLTSAMANAGRLSHMKEEQQAYLTLSSAVKLVQQELGDMAYKGEIITINGDASAAETDTSVTPEESAVSGMVKAWADYIFCEELFEPSGRFTIISEVDDVEADFKMNSTENGKYAITIVFTLEDNSDYSMELAASATVTGDESKKEEWVEGSAGLELKTTVTRTTTVKWLGSEIVKGDDNG